MTRKSITIIIALAAVALLTGGYFGAQAWIKAHPKVSPNLADLPESPRLTEFDSAKLARIENAGEGFVLERKGDTWELVSANVPVEKVKIEQSVVSNKLWSMSSVWAESLVDENPADLSMFGLDNPSAHVIIADSDGKRAEFLFGNFTPSRTSFYVMVAGDPKVYTLSSYSKDSLAFTLDSVRDKSLLVNLDPATVSRLILEPRPEEASGAKGAIDISARQESDYLISSFCGYVLNTPYTKRQGVDSDKFGKLLENLAGLGIREYVDDEPASLAPYGLDKPGRFYLETPEQSLDLLFGRSENGLRYAKLAGEDSVFTLEGFEPLAAASPFDLMDKFALIFSIDHVDTLTVSSGGQTLEAAIQGTGDEAIFHLDGKKTADKEFRAFYQAVIGLLIDAEYSGAEGEGEGADLVVEYQMNTPPGLHASIRLIPYNRDFYVLEKEGVREFLIARTQVRKIFDTAEKMVYAE